MLRVTLVALGKPNYRKAVIRAPWLASSGANPHPVQPYNLMIRDAFRKEGAANIQAANKIVSAWAKDSKIAKQYRAESEVNNRNRTVIPKSVTPFGEFIRANRSVVPRTGTLVQRMAAIRKAFNGLSTAERQQYQTAAEKKNAARSSIIDTLEASYRKRINRSAEPKKVKKAKTAKKAKK